MTSTILNNLYQYIFLAASVHYHIISPLSKGKLALYL